MTLIDLVKIINEIDDELIIFINDKNDFNSEIVLSNEDNIQNGMSNINGKEFYYLIEVFLAVEIINDWINTLTDKPSDYEIAKRLYEYAINDA